jgi:hypothetical protein
MAAWVDFVARVFAHVSVVFIDTTCGGDTSNSEECDGRHSKQNLLFHQLSFK